MVDILAGLAEEGVGSMGNIKVGIIGVGNCFAGLWQGIEFYKRNPDKKIVGIMHEKMGDYSIFDLEFTSAFDVGENKVGKPLHEAMYAYPNMVNWIPKEEFQKSSTIVTEGPALDGVGIYVENRVKPVKGRPMATLRKEILKVIETSGTEVLVNYLPVGSQKATEFWAEIALETGCAFVNNMPVFIASTEAWEKRFQKAGVPILGDDTKGMIGATIVHRTLARLCDYRGALIDRTYQINVGGNSVTGDQKILLEIGGKITQTPIGEFIDSMMMAHGEHRADGKEIVDLAQAGKMVRCFTIDDDFKTVMAEVYGLVRHLLDEELYEVKTSEGRKITVTKDHNVFKLNWDGKLEPVPVHELREEETYIAAPCSLHTGNAADNRTANLAPYLKELFARGVDSAGNIIIHNHPEIKIPVEFPLTDELLRVVGLWLADGSFDREGSANLEIACGNDEECVMCIERFVQPYHINYKIRGQAQVSVQLMSKTMAKIFKLCLGLGGNSYTKRVPGWVFGLSARQIALVLQGYLSGDGTVTGRQIRWTTASPGLAEDMRTLFLMVGINSGVLLEDYTSKNTTGSYKTALLYITHGIISSKDDFEAFADRVGFIQTDKTERALNVLAKLKRTGMHIIPKFELLRQWGIKSKSWDKLPTMRAHAVMRQLDKVTDDADRKKIFDICNGDTRFLKIKSIKKIPAKPQYVYDLSVPGSERFVCSDILVHNTDFLSMKELMRLESKKISKTKSVTSQLTQKIDPDNIYIGPSDFIPFLKNTKLAFIRIAGRMWADVPFSAEMRLEVDDKANSGGVVIDAIRAAKIGLDRKIGGALLSASAVLMKKPPVQYTDEVALRNLDEFINGKRER